MTTNLAYSLPDPRKRDYDARPTRVRIVTTFAQRSARPRITYALVAIAVVFGIFMAQLLLTISLSSGAYGIARLQNQQHSLGLVASSLNEKLQALGSAQNLAANAQQLGMVSTSAPAYLTLSNGSVSGTPTAAAAVATTAVTSGSTGAVPNYLLNNVPVISPTASGHGESNAADSGSTTTQSTGANTLSADPLSSGSVDPGALPSPVTH